MVWHVEMVYDVNPFNRTSMELKLVLSAAMLKQ